MRRLAKAFGLGLAAGLAACSSDGTGPGDNLLNQDVATVAAEAAAQDVELMRGPGGHFGLRLPADPSHFECESTSREGLMITRSCAIRDANGNLQAAYDAQTTASVTVHAEVSGTIDRGHWSATVHRVGDFTVSGLAGTETRITWNGSGTGTSSRVRQTEGGETRQFDMTETETVQNVVIPVPHTETSWPLSGTIHTTATVKITGGPDNSTTRQRDVTITFNGTQFATVTVNGDTFQFDLAGRGRAKRGHP